MVFIKIWEKQNCRLCKVGLKKIHIQVHRNWDRGLGGYSSPQNFSKADLFQIDNDSKKK